MARDVTVLCGLVGYSEDSPSGLVWLVERGRKCKPGSPAGCLTKFGYWYIGCGYRHYLAHRFVWFLHNGEIPNGLDIDHIDGDRSNNKISNLRLATRSQNLRNKKISKSNKTGFKGVFKLPNGRFQSSIRVNGKQNYLGVFSTAEEAGLAYDLAAMEFYGEFAKTNFKTKK